MAAPWPGKGVISLNEFSAYTGRSAKVLRGMIRRGEMQANRMGRCWTIARAEAFRVIGVVDPEGASPAPVSLLPPRPPLAPELEAVVRRHLAR